MLNIMTVAQAQGTLLYRPDWDELEVSPLLQERTNALFGEPLTPDEAVRRILKSVKKGGDKALADWSTRLDGFDPGDAGFRVAESELQSAAGKIEPRTLQALKTSAERILSFHQKQPAQSWMDATAGVLGQKICPLGRVGVYVPGGSAPLASTLLMMVMVARAAGVRDVVVVSPPDRATGKVAPVTLAAAVIAGVTEVHALGGAHAIGALAYGTASIRKVDKIVGPGNTFVVLAKRQVFGVVGIDSLPGPTETIVVADESARADWVAADLMAQAEHAGGSALLLTPSRALADAVNLELVRQCPALSTRSAIEDSFRHRSGAVITASLAEAVALADEYAPEHLCLSVVDPWSWIGQINRAGGVFLGEHSFEVLGDYVAGPSHTMPTGGTARFSSPCNVWDFVRVMSVVALDEKSSHALAPAAADLADAEGLAAHAHSARIRNASVD